MLQRGYRRRNDGAIGRVEARLGMWRNTRRTRVVGVAVALGLVAVAASPSRAVRRNRGLRLPADLAARHCNVHWTNSSTFPVPGRGLVLSWAPSGSAVAGGNAIAVGGHLIGSQTFLQSGERYDTKIFDTGTGST